MSTSELASQDGVGSVFALWFASACRARPALRQRHQRQGDRCGTSKVASAGGADHGDEDQSGAQDADQVIATLLMLDLLRISRPGEETASAQGPADPAIA
jgi:hypothetical protein